ncbi:MAG: recombination regulator RecX [Betaproteobacteria bacterium]|nr:recombination regulator RecX [Betaproteobacteria bacterium]
MGRRSGPPLSLRARALAHLARREHSRTELARKLAPHAPDPDALDAVLEGLAREGLLSDQRFIESLVRRRGARYGVRRLEQELAEHRLAGEVSAEPLAEFRRAEPELAWQAWERRFGAPPADLAERARQQRFLMARGFGADAVASVFRRLRALPEASAAERSAGATPD